MTPEYQIVVHGHYDFIKKDDNIKAARAWAKKAFPKMAVSVSRHFALTFCGDCQSSPCCCMVRRDVSVHS